MSISRVQMEPKNSEGKKQKILTAATVQFTEKGYAATSMENIAKYADVSKQTVYSHFGSKDNLFAEAIKKKCESSQMFALKDLDLTNVEAALLLIAKRFIAMLTSKEAIAVHKICAYESNTYPQLSELFYKEGPERITNEVADLMQELNQQQLLDITNPHFAALQFLNLIKGEVWMRTEFNIQEPLHAAEIELYLISSIGLFVRGYRLS